MAEPLLSNLLYLAWHLIFLKQIFKANFLRNKCPSSLKFIAVSISLKDDTFLHWHCQSHLFVKFYCLFLLDCQVDAVMCRCGISLCSLTGSFWQKNWWTPGRFILPELWVCPLGYSFFFCFSMCLSTCLSTCLLVCLSRCLSVCPSVSICLSNCGIRSFSPQFD